MGSSAFRQPPSVRRNMVSSLSTNIGLFVLGVWLVIRPAQAAANKAEDPAGPPCSICGSIPLLAHHPVLTQAVRFLGILSDAFKQCTAIGRKTTAKGGKGCHFRIKDTTRLSTFMGRGLE